MKNIHKLLIIFVCTISIISCRNDGPKSILKAESASSTTSSSTDDNYPILDEGYIILFTNSFSDKISPFIDLDSGCFSGMGNIENADVKLETSCGSDCYTYLTPVNGAKRYLLNSESEENFYIQCIDNLSIFTPGNIPDFSSGNPICILTNENKIAVLTFANIGCSYRTASCVIFECIVWDNSVNEK
jgi:hypothetical protein